MDHEGPWMLWNNASVGKLTKLGSSFMKVAWKSVYIIDWGDKMDTKGSYKVKAAKRNGGNYQKIVGFPGVSYGKESACHTGDLSWIPGLGRSPGGGNGNPLQYSCLENPHGLKSLTSCSPWGWKGWDTTEWLRAAPEDRKDEEGCEKFPELEPCGSVAAPFSYHQTSGNAGEILEDWGVYLCIQRYACYRMFLMRNLSL